MVTGELSIKMYSKNQKKGQGLYQALGIQASYMLLETHPCKKKQSSETTTSTARYLENLGTLKSESCWQAAKQGQQRFN